MMGYGGIFGGPAMWGATKPYQGKPFANMGMAQQQRPMPEEQKKSGGFFGQGGAGRGIAGTIGDYLLQTSGMQPVFAPAMHQRRQQQMALEAEKRAMANQREMMRYGMDLKQQYARPDAPKPGSFEWWNDPNTSDEERRRYEQFNPLLKFTPWAGTERISRLGGQQSLGGPQVGAVEDGYRFKGGDPANPDNWEAM